MVNATSGNGCCDATSELSTLTPEEGAKQNSSSSKLCGCGLDSPHNDEGDAPSPTGSETWRTPNSSDSLMKMEAMFSAGATPVDVIKALYPRVKEPPEGWSEHLIMSILAEILDRPPTRNKLPQYNTFEDAVELFRHVLTQILYVFLHTVRALTDLTTCNLSDELAVINGIESGTHDDEHSRPTRRLRRPHCIALQRAVTAAVKTANSSLNFLSSGLTRKRILVLTGAGVSVSCGIPDFRSKDGIYARLHADFPDLPDPTAMFDIRYFNTNPAPFYDFASEIFPGQFEPSISHKFIRQLEVNGQLLRNYTQNIDTLEKQANIEKVVECHGSFSKATCLKCHAKFDGDVIREDVMAKRVAHCPHCTDGVIKPDIVFFGEELDKTFHTQMAADKDELDLLVVIGSSLKVRPVSLIPFSVDHNVPQILINREPLSGYRADIELLGNCDEIIEDICIALGGSFVEMLETHQNKVKGPSCHSLNGHSCHSEVHETTSKTISRLVRKRRRIAEKQEFLQIMKALEISEGSKMSEDVECDSEMKRPRLENMYQRRYVPVAKHLPEHTYLQISTNRAIFPGAELYYDLETGAICQPTSYRPDGDARFEVDSDDEDHGDDDDGSCTGMASRACSMPDISEEQCAHLAPYARLTQLLSGRDKGEEPASESAGNTGRLQSYGIACVAMVDFGERASSCEPSIDLDERISREQFNLQLKAPNNDSDHDDP
ncbi:unnamed protein product [Nippostrongylus brasiliensis]|uniref:NAD-dependent protein deacetylase sir-2.1 n=1 Tax=Nippostrongylus brasiliensis TaxID=27835 RepID=A0A0N4XY74_NIPBR|nr:unnamed protein product [Nippostrongylus brasiliensis]